MKYTSLPVQDLQSWAFINNVQLHGVAIKPHIVDHDGNERGGGIVATADHGPSNNLMTIPNDLILNREAVENAARSDKYLREVLDSFDEAFLQTPRRVIMIFLLLQLTYSSSSFEGKSLGVTTPWTDYVKFLPKDIPLPTRWTSDEQNLLSGTSAEAALQQKLQSLQREFEQVKLSTQKITWCQKLWWDDEENLISLSDWNVADAIYRSRGLELPHGVGHSMLPVLDMTNHSGYDANNARFQIDEDGNVQLVVRADRCIKAGEEVTITYGFGGACEMVFSYGFLDLAIENAREMFLSFTIPDDDPLRRAKAEFSREAPGVKIYIDDLAETKWEGPLVWWACVNEEDGLDFQVVRQTNGATELKAVWKDVNLEAGNLQDVLMRDPLWEVFLLRATVLVQSRVEQQGRELSISQEAFDKGIEHGEEYDLNVVDMVNRLRDLEMELLATSYQTLENEKAQLLGSDTVRTYLNKMNPDRNDALDEDFS